MDKAWRVVMIATLLLASAAVVAGSSGGFLLGRHLAPATETSTIGTTKELVVGVSLVLYSTLLLVGVGWFLRHVGQQLHSRQTDGRILPQEEARN